MVEWTEVTLVDGLIVRLVASNLGLCAIDFQVSGPIEGTRNDANPIAAETARQLRAYFAGRLRRFDLTLDMRGTEFQRRVWHRLEGIPYGQTRSYRQIAVEIGSPLAVRAVGAANGANPIPIVVPCHRVIGSSGKLVGYGGGLPLKKRLLAMEGALALPLGYGNEGQ
ncbi:MAG: methylated-DNA--[protein]-cysteine S-methyltransferase [Ignavibacteriota bacterium]